MQNINIKSYITINNRSYTKEEVLKGSVGIDPQLNEFLQQWWNNSMTLSVQTSGSTGVPKKIEVLKSAMITSASKTVQYFKLKPDMSALLALPLTFIAGKMMVVRALVGGLNLITVTPSGNPLYWLSQSVDFAAFTPMQMMNELDKNSSKLQYLKLVIIGGGKVSDALNNRLQNVGFLAFETYGMTETLSHVALRRINGSKPQTSFFPLDEVEMMIDAKGCLAIDFPGVTNELVVTNDLAKFNQDGSFTLLGRADHVINSGGVKIFPEEVEGKLEGILEVPFIISALPHTKLGQQVILITEGDTSYSQEELLSKIQKRVSKFEVPISIFSIKKISRTESGKVRRQEVLNQLQILLGNK
ncbi:MAG TPA: AMP-binding protein [Marinilabiliaceae bacterium]|nr:AMP-binding protein [Marinilabiliaceae bacterium]